MTIVVMWVLALSPGPVSSGYDSCGSLGGILEKELVQKSAAKMSGIGAYSRIIDKPKIFTDGSVAAAHCKRALLLENQGKLKEAKRDLDTSIRILPTYVEAFMHRARVNALQKNLRSALTDYSTAIRIKPDVRFVYGDRGYIHMLLENYDAAIRDLSIEIKRGPFGYDNFSLRGDAYAAVQMYGDALTDYNTALAYLNSRGTCPPEDRGCYNVQEVQIFGKIAAIYGQKGEFDRVIETYTEAVQRNPGSADLHRGLAETCLRSQDVQRQKVVQCLKYALKANEITKGRDAVTLHLLARAYLFNDKLEKAQRKAKAALYLDPNNEDYRLTLEKIEAAIRGK